MRACVRARVCVVYARVRAHVDTVVIADSLAHTHRFGDTHFGTLNGLTLSSTGIINFSQVSSRARPAPPGSASLHL
jgi:hypothetical protein